MLSAGIAGSSLEPTGARSRRASRDGGPLPKEEGSGGGTALAEPAEQQQQQQQQQLEEDVSIAGALLQAFPNAVGAAEDQQEDGGDS
jgi:hypothetical protein